jgi:hypothetical protein
MRAPSVSGSDAINARRASAPARRVDEYLDHRIERRVSALPSGGQSSMKPDRIEAGVQHGREHAAQAGGSNHR